MIPSYNMLEKQHYRRYRNIGKDLYTAKVFANKFYIPYSASNLIATSVFLCSVEANYKLDITSDVSKSYVNIWTFAGGEIPDKEYNTVSDSPVAPTVSLQEFVDSFQHFFVETKDDFGNSYFTDIFEFAKCKNLYVTENQKPFVGIGIALNDADLLGIPTSSLTTEIYSILFFESELVLANPSISEEKTTDSVGNESVVYRRVTNRLQFQFVATDSLVKVLSSAVATKNSYIVANDEYYQLTNPVAEFDPSPDRQYFVVKITFDETSTLVTNC